MKTNLMYVLFLSILFHSCSIEKTDITIDNKDVSIEILLSKSNNLHTIDSLLLPRCKSNDIKYSSTLNIDSTITLFFSTASFKNANYFMLSLNNINLNPLNFHFEETEDSNIILININKIEFNENSVIAIHSKYNQLNCRPAYIEQPSGFLHVDNISEKSVIYRLTPSQDSVKQGTVSISIGYKDKTVLGKFITSQSIIFVIGILASLSTILGITVSSIIKYFRK